MHIAMVIIIVCRYIIIRRACDDDEVKSHFIELYYDYITDTYIEISQLACIPIQVGIYTVRIGCCRKLDFREISFSFNYNYYYYSVRRCNVYNII